MSRTVTIPPFPGSRQVWTACESVSISPGTCVSCRAEHPRQVLIFLVLGIRFCETCVLTRPLEVARAVESHRGKRG